MVSAEPVPTPPIATIAPITPDIVLPIQPLPTTTTIISDIIDTHPIEPVISTNIPKLYRPPKFNHYKHSRANIANIHVCHRPMREIIPNAVCPDEMPRFISHRFRNRKGKTRCWFTVTFNNYRIEYSYGGRSGYSKENAFMEAARCLRHLLVNQIQLLDNSMGLAVDVDDIFDIIFDHDDIDDEYSESTNTISTTSNQPPIINITNSNVTISNTPHRNIVYGEDDNLEFVFESPEGTFGAPPAEGDDIEGFEGFDFGEIIEI